MAGKAGRRGWGYLRRLPSKRWQASYIGPDLTRHRAPHTYTSKMDAEVWLSNERRLIERDEWTPPALRSAAQQAQAVTLAVYADRWLTQRDLKPRTRDQYATVLRQHINPVLGDVPLCHLNAETVRAWYAATLTDKPTYRASAYRVLRAVLTTATTDGLLPSNPCRIPNAGTAKRASKTVIIDVPDLARLADAMPDEYRALVLVSAWCGLRWGEVTELRRKDVSADVISVARGVTHRDGQCHVDTPKSGRIHAVVMPPHIRDDVAAHLARFTGADSEALVFGGGRSCHLSAMTFRRHFNQALTAIGHEHIRIHDLRHFAGTQTARVGSLKETMDRLGHSTVAASLRYQGLASGRDVAVAEALSELAKG